MKMLRTLIALALLACATTLFGMGAWGAMYKGIDDLADEIHAWNIECASKSTDPDCARNAAALKKKAEELAQFADGLASANDPDTDGHVDPPDAGWRKTWRLAARIVRYHGKCFKQAHAECATEWLAIYRERVRLGDDSPLSHAGYFYTDRDAVKWLLGTNPNIKRPTP
jgi:hypothetical protein